MASQTYVDTAVKALRDELTEQLDKLKSMVCSYIPDMKEKMEKFKQKTSASKQEIGQEILQRPSQDVFVENIE